LKFGQIIGLGVLLILNVYRSCSYFAVHHNTLAMAYPVAYLHSVINYYFILKFTTMQNSKWFYSLQEKIEAKIAISYETAGYCNYQVINPDVYIECWPVIRKADQKSSVIIVTAHRQTGFIFIYEYQY